MVTPLPDVPVLQLDPGETQKDLPLGCTVVLVVLWVLVETDVLGLRRDGVTLLLLGIHDGFLKTVRLECPVFRPGGVCARDFVRLPVFG